MYMRPDRLLPMPPAAHPLIERRYGLGPQRNGEAAATAQFRTIESAITATTSEACPVVFLHGLFGRPEDWASTMEFLAGERRLIALEFPLATLPVASTSMEGLADYTIAFLDRAGIQRAVLIGNSLGGHVALKLALQQPARVAAVGLLGSSGLYERQITPRATIVTRQQLRRMIGEVFYDQRHVTDALIDEAYAALRDRHHRRRIILLARSARNENLADRLGAVRQPTMIAWGAEDTVTPLEVAEEFHAGISQSELHILPKCCHAPQMEYPEEVAALLARFLERLGLSGRLDPAAHRRPAHGGAHLHSGQRRAGGTPLLSAGGDERLAAEAGR